MVMAWVKRRELRQSPWFATGVLLLVCVHNAFTVTLLMSRRDPAGFARHNARRWQSRRKPARCWPALAL
ncbi:hypothetical protein ACU4GD_46075 [Cupriavidus basilensis]